MDHTITTDFEGVYQEIELKKINGFLEQVAQISTDSREFIKNAGYGITDEIIGMDSGDPAKLEEWYHNIFLNS